VETPAAPPKTAIEEDVLSALTNLGYQRPAAERALAQATKNGKEVSFEALFRNTLAALSK
jgi:Holliday junction resolvasome RuvABC DNA-binding subunit